MNFRNLCLFILLMVGSGHVRAQLLNAETAAVFTRADSLRGTLSPLRSCYDVGFYLLDIKVDLVNQSISGSNKIRFKVTEPFSRLQLDLYENMKVDKIVFQNKFLPFEREFNALFVQLPEVQKVGDILEMEVFYSGKPTAAKRAPWDGGFVWTKDAKGKPWVGVACQGAGASLWWPCKDHQSDEPDSMQISITVPKGLMEVSNGRLRSKKTLPDGATRFDWFVTYPINTYSVTLNIADYATFSDTYQGTEPKPLSLDYYVLRENLSKAKKQFSQVKPMMACFEKYFGPYPFYRDGYKLVESPYLGMEHQSAVAYGNGYQQGYLGGASSSVGLKFDYIIIHESGHEWWGNSVSSKDIADMWIHESFTTYSEALYVECQYGHPAALTYMNAQKPTVTNEEPIIGPYGVNKEGSGDMYNKGMLMLNTLRNVVNDDKHWFDAIYGLCQDFRYKTITAEELISSFNKRLGNDYTYFFDQYLRYPRLPKLLLYYVQKDGKTFATFRWETDAKDFRMPVKITTAKGKYEFIEPTTEFKSVLLNDVRFEDFRVAEDLFYIRTHISSQYFDPKENER
jgi:aminopeptidase N